MWKQSLFVIPYQRIKEIKNHTLQRISIKAGTALLNFIAATYSNIFSNIFRAGWIKETNKNSTYFHVFSAP